MQATLHGVRPSSTPAAGSCSARTCMLSKRRPPKRPQDGSHGAEQHCPRLDAQGQQLLDLLDDLHARSSVRPLAS